jgi:predicted RNA-binding Zn-ribbon protein involved in translation (DUF1610 family)
MPTVKLEENHYVKTCRRCGTQLEYMKNEKGKWISPNASFEVGKFYVSLVCPKCGWRQDTNIRPKNVDESEI